MVGPEESGLQRDQTQSPITECASAQKHAVPSQNARATRPPLPGTFADRHRSETMLPPDAPGSSHDTTPLQRRFAMLLPRAPKTIPPTQICQLFRHDPIAFRSRGERDRPFPDQGRLARRQPDEELNGPGRSDGQRLSLQGPANSGGGFPPEPGQALELFRRGDHHRFDASIKTGGHTCCWKRQESLATNAGFGVCSSACAKDA